MAKDKVNVTQKPSIEDAFIAWEALGTAGCDYGGDASDDNAAALREKALAYARMVLAVQGNLDHGN